HHPVHRLAQPGDEDRLPTRVREPRLLPPIPRRGIIIGGPLVPTIYDEHARLRPREGRLVEGRLPARVEDRLRRITPHRRPESRHPTKRPQHRHRVGGRDVVVLPRPLPDHRDPLLPAPAPYGVHELLGRAVKDITATHGTHYPQKMRD